MNRFINLLIIVFFAFLISCSSTSYKYINIQVLNPSDTMLPVNTSKLHIVDPCGQKESKNICIKDLNQSVFDTTLKQNIEQSPSFKNITIAIQKEGEIKEEMKNKPSGLHVLLTSNYNVKVDTSDFENRAYTYFGNYILTYHAKVELSDLKTRKPYDTFQYADSFSWPRQNSQGFLIKRKLTDLLAETEYIAAIRYANHIASYWTTDQRMYYYSSSHLMDIANTRFEENDLDGAITLWKEVYAKENTKLKAFAAYNLGLAYEMLDDLNECESWLLKSKQIKRYAPVYNYLSIIKKRKTQHAHLDQMFHD
jgi:tetratricopeptide (TPR) repeat protein